MRRSRACPAIRFQRSETGERMTIDRLGDVPGFLIDRVAAARTDPDGLRLENLDTNHRPPSGRTWSEYLRVTNRTHAAL